MFNFKLLNAFFKKQVWIWCCHFSALFAMFGHTGLFVLNRFWNLIYSNFFCAFSQIFVRFKEFRENICFRLMFTVGLCDIGQLLSFLITIGFTYFLLPIDGLFEKVNLFDFEQICILYEKFKFIQTNILYERYKIVF